MAADTPLAFRHFLTAVSASDAPAANLTQEDAQGKDEQSVEPASGNSGNNKGVTTPLF